jgi:hypothetical protein
MRGWLERLWRDIQGNVKWDALKTIAGFIKDWWVPMLTAILSVTFWFKHLSVPSRLLIVTPLLAWLVQGIVNAVRRIRRPHQRCPLTLIPHGDKDTDVYLEVVNEGDPVSVSAQLRVVGVSTGVSFKQYAYDGEWRATLTFQDVRYGTIPYRSTKGVHIETGKSKLLRIATFFIPREAFGDSNMSLVGINESIMWDIELKPGEVLPFFVVQIVLLCKGYRKSIIRKYRVGPIKSYGPIEMVEVPS